MLRLVTRWWSPNDILTIGMDLSMKCTASEELMIAFKTVLPSHLLVLLYVVDVCMKFSDGGHAAVLKVVPSLVAAARRSACSAMAYEIHALFVHWVELSLLCSRDVFPTAALVLGSWRTYECEHTGCEARFVSATQRAVHMDLHFDERVYALLENDNAALAEERGHKAYVTDITGTSTAITWSGFFSKRRTAIALRNHNPSCVRAGSPVRTTCCLPALRSSSCPVCGDSLPEKRYADEMCDWVYDDCVKYDGRILHASCHILCE